MTLTQQQREQLIKLYPDLAPFLKQQEINQDFIDALDKLKETVEKTHPKDIQEIIDTIKKEKGEKGERGEKGDKGDTGEKGERGEQGIAGEKGEKGDAGKNGYDGIDGLNGKDGKDGLDGKDVDPKVIEELDKKVLDGMAKVDGRIKAIDQRWHGAGLSKVSTDSTLTGTGTPSSPLHVVGGSPLTAKGDIYGHSTVDARIPVGTNGQVLTADSTQALGVKYATPVGTIGGSITSGQVAFGDTTANTIKGTANATLNAAGQLTTAGAASLANTVLVVDSGGTATVNGGFHVTSTSQFDGSTFFGSGGMEIDNSGSVYIPSANSLYLGSQSQILNAPSLYWDGVDNFYINGTNNDSGVASIHITPDPTLPPNFTITNNSAGYFSNTSGSSNSGVVLRGDAGTDTNTTIGIDTSTGDGYIQSSNLAQGGADTNLYLGSGTGAGNVNLGLNADNVNLQNSMFFGPSGVFTIGIGGLDISAASINQTGDIIGGSYTGSDLTASKPVFTDANKKLVSTGVVPVANGGTGASTQNFPSTLFNHFADVGNSTTTETDLYTDTTAAGQLGTNGNKLCATYAGIFVSSATATRELRCYFGGTLIFDTGALSISAGSDAWQVDVTIIRESSTVVRCSVIATTAGASLNIYDNYTRVTGLTLANTNILKITGQAAGVGAASNDIVSKLGYVQFIP